MSDVSLEDVRHAREAVYRVARLTPLVPTASLGELVGAELLLKAECLQHTGSFKVRGAANKLASLTDDERRRGVIAASAGNHAQGVAVAARSFESSATVVMPEHASLAKVQAARAYGAEVILHGADFGAAYAEANRLAAERNLVFISAYDDAAVIAGQGTLALELIDQAPDAGLVLVPVGGGGLIAGIALVLKAISPQTRIIGVQASAAPAVARSFASSSIVEARPEPTLADGVAVPHPGELPMALIRRYVDDIVIVDEEAIARAIVILLERSRLVVEGAGALAMAALISGAVSPAGLKTVAVLSGGNIDVNLLPGIVQHGLLHAGRYLTLFMDIDDEPGRLAGLLSLIASTGANVVDIEHLRQGLELPVRGVQVRFLLETRDSSHIEELTATLAAAGFQLTESSATRRCFRPVSWINRD